MKRALRAALLAGGLVMTQEAAAEPTHTILSFSELDGWALDDHRAALDVFLETCPDLVEPDWAALCALGQTQENPRAFFEHFFRPVLVQDGTRPLFTGYYEPELSGALARDATHRFPIYRKPPELGAETTWFTRAQIETEGHLEDRGLEIAWVDDPVEAFFLQVQGSGRITLPDGSRIRVGYGGANGQPYRSVGQELVRRGVYAPHQVSADVIRSWVRRNPDEGVELLRHNPSFVFFREVTEVPAEKGPLGAMNRSITPLRTVAVDPEFTPLGAPVWIDKDGIEPMRRLMIAQDTGSAIKGAQRADIFFGTGIGAGRRAGRVRDGGRMIVLMPIDRALSAALEG